MQKPQINYEKLYYYSFLLFAFTLPLSRAAISFFIIFLPLVWMFEGGFQEKIKKIKKLKPLYFLILWILLSSISIFWSENKSLAIDMIRYNLYFFTAVVIATKLKKDKVEDVITAFLSGMFISEIISYGIFFEFWSVNNKPYTNPSPFMIHIEYSVFLALTSILLFYRLLSKNYNWKQKLFLGFFFLTVTGNLFLVPGRTGQVAYIAAVFMMFLLHYRFSLKSILFSIFSLLIIFYSAYNESENFKNRVHQTKKELQQIQSFNLSSSWGIRVTYWIASYHILKEHPFGLGIGDFKLAVNEELAKHPERYTMTSSHAQKIIRSYHPHNQYLLVLLQNGIVGLALFIAFFVSFWRFDTKGKEYNDMKKLFLTIFLVGFLGEPLLIKQFVLALFVLFGGLFMGLSF